MRTTHELRSASQRGRVERVLTQHKQHGKFLSAQSLNSGIIYRLIPSRSGVVIATTLNGQSQKL
ncbi:MAG: hypothetical protein HS122_07850 [Opitutaceae bacterium]|nr:hypothetical protein [Opitutaceae bacterium]